MNGMSSLGSRTRQGKLRFRLLGSALPLTACFLGAGRVPAPVSPPAPTASPRYLPGAASEAASIAAVGPSQPPAGQELNLAALVSQGPSVPASAPAPGPLPDPFHQDPPPATETLSVRAGFPQPAPPSPPPQRSDPPVAASLLNPPQRQPPQAQAASSKAKVEAGRRPTETLPSALRNGGSPRSAAIAATGPVPAAAPRSVPLTEKGVAPSSLSSVLKVFSVTGIKLSVL